MKWWAAAHCMETLSFTVKKPHESDEYRDVTALTIPTQEGTIQVLPGHADMVLESTPGICTITRIAGNESLELHSAGIIRVRNDVAVLIL